MASREDEFASHANRRARCEAYCVVLADKAEQGGRSKYPFAVLALYMDQSPSTPGQMYLIIVEGRAT
jgi:hypothetical protein